MRRLKMSWNSEGGHLVCRWIELKEKCETFSVADMMIEVCGSTMAQFAGRLSGRLDIALV
jgi:hypothetical protein